MKFFYSNMENLLRYKEGLQGLAALANEKVYKLAKISSEGVEKMAKLMLTKGSGKYEDYQDWAMKLQEVYEDEAQKIMDVYMKSAM